ncbi:glycosyltransferase family 4 protein [Ornithinimicrobium avium]|uniref:Glycosyltransferase n=1 Tax=Ornithinimicrobium avium TaxID=2283195 RepID=A0A345NPC5_9MICO|nr:glycosyltransferase family 4 protein [Ornithinimicrobium avium]AXH96883.1 glycosyltransferase [Ornithinimicrobium avium]
MKIRHLVLTASFAGAEQHVCGLANAQARHGHDVEVWGGDSAAMRERLAGNVSFAPCRGIGEALRLSRLASRVDILHAHMTKAEVAATAAARLFTHPARVVTTRHFAAVRGASLRGHMARPFLRRAVATQIAVSAFVAANIDGDSTVVYAGVDPQVEVTRPREDVILVAQRLSPEKRTLDALDAFAASGLAAQGWRLEIAGRGSQHDALVARATSLGLGEQLVFLGFVDDLADRMRRAAMVLATATAEPFGLTVVEAMAHGTPVVASASGGHLETVGLVGDRFLFAPGRTDEAGHMLAVMAADAAASSVYGRELRAVQRERFTPDRQYTDTQTVYEKVLAT